MTTVRIALLKCGDLKGKAHEQNGGYDEIYNNWLQASFPNPLLNKFTLDSYNVVQDVYPNEDLYDCIMLTGSGTTPSNTRKFYTNAPSTAASAYEDKQWINKLTHYIAHVAENKPYVKIVGA